VELSEVIRRRRMVHRFERREPPAELVDEVLESALHAPSAGFSQGFAMVLLREPERVRRFWELTLPPSEAAALDAIAGTGPPVLVLCLVSKAVYLERYSRPDKAAANMREAEQWPVPYWYVDGGMSVLMMLLRAVDLGLGGWFFGVAHGERELRQELGIPEGHDLVGVLGLGYRAEEDRPSGSATTIRRRRLDDVLHRDAW
jgi:nitroreductase